MYKEIIEHINFSFKDVIVEFAQPQVVTSIFLSGLNCHTNPNQLKHCHWSLSLFGTGWKQGGLS